MRRLSFLSFCVLFIVIICGVYRVANQYQIIEKKVDHYNEESEEEHENIRVLQAEWAYLTNPVRLEKIARENFQLQPVDGAQTVAIADIPVRATLDAQQAQSNIAEDDTPKKLIVPAKSLPVGVRTVASNDDSNTAMAAAMPVTASQALPPIEATPVSEQVTR